MSSRQFLNKVFYKNSQKMGEIPDGVIDLIVTSPPYFNVKDYSLDGYQQQRHSSRNGSQLGDVDHYPSFIAGLLKVWQECERVLRPNGKLVINSPLMPMKKSEYSTHYNRHIFDLNADIQHSILYQKNTALFLLDVYVWERTNARKGLMFGSYPFPPNYYAQNTSEFITVYVKGGKPLKRVSQAVKAASRLTQDEWVEFTKQVWRIPVPDRKDLAYGEHSAIMPEEIVYRCLRLFTFLGDTILDPFAGSGTTLKVAKENGRNYVGYELMDTYRPVIEKKLTAARQNSLGFTDG